MQIYSVNLTGLTAHPKCGACNHLLSNLWDASGGN